MPRTRPSPQPRPAGYPARYECIRGLADRRRVRIRPILPSDAPELAEAIRTADPETLRARFLGAPPPITSTTLDDLTRLDYVRRFALVAFARGHGVGIARYIAGPPEGEGAATAEVAVAVAPEWRRVGLATILLELLARRAIECGITAFTATYLAQNRPVAELASGSNARTLIADGIGELRAQLPDAPH